MPKFPCPKCGQDRENEMVDCNACGWKRRVPGVGRAGENKCPICGGVSFTWGYLSGKHGGPQFRHGQESAAEAVAGMLGVGGEDLAARLCGTCGNVQFFVQ